MGRFYEYFISSICFITIFSFDYVGGHKKVIALLLGIGAVLTTCMASIITRIYFNKK